MRRTDHVGFPSSAPFLVVVVVFVVDLFIFSSLLFMDPIALRLVCHGTDEHPLRLTRTATLHTQGLDSLVDGTHRAVHVGRDADRDVYRVGESMVLKLCASDKERRSHSNQREAAALQATQHLRQTSKGTAPLRCLRKAVVAPTALRTR